MALVVKLSQSWECHRLPMTRSTLNELPKREERRGGDRLPAREPTRGWRKHLEAIRDSACAALEAAGGPDEEEEEEEDHTTYRHQPLAGMPQATGLPRRWRPGCSQRWKCRARIQPQTGRQAGARALDRAVANHLHRAAWAELSSDYERLPDQGKGGIGSQHQGLP